MPRWSFPSVHRAVLIPGALALIVTACSKSYDGVSDADREEMAKQTAIEAAKGSGFKMTEKNYPLGKGWVVDLKGATITDDHIRRIKEVGKVAELDLSKSTVTDAHLALLREIGAGTTLYRLDLSHTAVTDAGLEKLAGLPLLVNLTATGSKITPSGADRYRSTRQNDPQIGAQFRSATVTR